MVCLSATPPTPSMSGIPAAPPSRRTASLIQHAATTSQQFYPTHVPRHSAYPTGPMASEYAYQSPPASLWGYSNIPPVAPSAYAAPGGVQSRVVMPGGGAGGMSSWRVGDVRGPDGVTQL